MSLIRLNSNSTSALVRIRRTNVFISSRISQYIWQNEAERRAMFKLATVGGHACPFEAGPGQSHQEGIHGSGNDNAMSLAETTMLTRVNFLSYNHPSKVNSR